jgi:phage recombination protein Bet
MSNALATLTSKLATRLEMGDGNGLIETLKATAFKGQVTDAQMTALMVVANQYGLNPWTKEIYAFPDKNNGIVPVVGVDGWARIINSHPQFDGMEFAQDDESCTCIMFRKDRTHPIKVTEYMSECKRSNTGPWTSHPKRMLRHKAMIQCARLAFGFGGIFDQDEAEVIAGEKNITGQATVEKVAELPAYTDEQMSLNLPTWIKMIQSGKATKPQIIAMVSKKYTLSQQQIASINNISEAEDGQLNEPEAAPIDPFVADMNAAEAK